MKILVIRFSSFGDILQSLSVAGRLAEDLPGAQIHWVTRSEYAGVLERHPAIHRVWGLDRRKGVVGLLSLGFDLRRQGFTHIYDAHNNLRSRILGWFLNGVLGWRVWTGKHRFLRRPIYRWKRILLFRFHINLFPRPFSGQRALLEPLAGWGLSTTFPPVPQLFLAPPTVASASARLPAGFSSFLALAPSAAYELKRWPIEYWKELIDLREGDRFVVLGGPEDGFLEALHRHSPTRVVNLAGRLSLEESAGIIALSRGLVANDTGLMHVAEQIGKPCVALMGPAPFGFPSRPTTAIMQLDLPCRPCSKHGQGPCVNPEFHKCMRGISAGSVARRLAEIVRA